jgi:hypothetical protein
MKHLALLGIAVLLVAGATSAFGAGTPPSTAGVTPVLVDPWSPAGGAMAEVNAAGCNPQYAFKVDGGDILAAGNNLTITDPDTGNVFTIIVTEPVAGTYNVAWTSNFPVSCVIVKGGTGANIYKYSTGLYGDSGLMPPYRYNPKTGALQGTYGVSHVTFGFNDPPMCWQGETAWADGSPYNADGQGNWALYVTYEAGQTMTVDLLAGQTMRAGTVNLAPGAYGTVAITVSLNAGWTFWDTTPEDGVAGSCIKIQDYATAPSGNPAPGGFDSKTTVSMANSTCTANVPLNHYYGIHVDVAHAVPCP